MKNTLSKRIYRMGGLPAGPIAAALIFFSLSFYLHLPYLHDFSRLEYLVVIIPPAGALGCYLLSRYFVRTFSASVLAGAVYAFCPLVLAFSAYHRFAGIPAAVLPWLFIPAVFIGSSKNTLSLANSAKAVFAILAAMAIPVFFYVLSLPSFGPFFPMPLIQAKLHNLTAIPMPLTGNAHEFVFSFYHLPLCAILFGLLICISSGSIILIILAAIGVSLTFAAPLFQTPPIAWGLMIALPCSILAGMGVENLVRAKKKFRLWALISAVTSAGLSVMAFANSQNLSGAIFAFTAIFAAVTIPVSAKPANFRFAIWLTFYTACCGDILWGSKHTLEQIFGNAFY